MSLRATAAFFSSAGRAAGAHPLACCNRCSVQAAICVAIFLPFDPPFEAYFDETDMAEIANIRAELT
ncbi:hypothetical protein [Burkholderia multivorans]|uniref:hypothetical protein n=1 Tax=Burkholderia multivorans TaxID=87883 RepID=UPI00143E6804|nr:hypothetical protein [Burkholderia multivorans]QIX16391.1 hypothetical protein FOB32_18900 [Burkholderia multivorans]